MSRYATPAAFRAALSARLTTLAETSVWSYQQLRRQFAYDRLLERLYMFDSEWVVKGAVALLAREVGVRGSLDVDVYRAHNVDRVEADVREALARDIGDRFRFDVGPREPVSDDSSAVRLPVVAYIGPQQWERFHIDLVGEEIRMTGDPVDVEAIAQLELADVNQGGYRAYPLVDHVADKVVATFDRYGTREAPSTRYRDLVDLVAIARGASVEADGQLRALQSEAARRGVTLPSSFEVPDREMWEPGYAKVAEQSVLADALTLDEAVAVVRPFLNPLLDRSARGRWDPERGAWVGDE